MIELKRTNDPILLSWLVAHLEAEGIGVAVFDAHFSIMEGSIDAIQRRIMVVEEDLGRAREILRKAGTSAAEDLPALSDDALLNGRVKLQQPSKGYRVAIDPVFLAAAVDAKETSVVLDAGCGAGAAALCLAERLYGVRVRGVEIDGFLADLASQNIKANKRAGHVDVIQGDILDMPPTLKAGTFDHVMANPPYRKAGSGNVPPDPKKAAATFEGEAVLGDWIDYCVKMVRPKGAVTLIHHAERLGELLGHMQESLGEIIVFPLWPGHGNKAAKRVIIRGRKGSTAPLRMAKGLVLHDDDGTFTPETQRILRDGLPLVL